MSFDGGGAQMFLIKLQSKYFPFREQKYFGGEIYKEHNKKFACLTERRYAKSFEKAQTAEKVGKRIKYICDNIVEYEVICVQDRGKR